MRRGNAKRLKCSWLRRESRQSARHRVKCHFNRAGIAWHFWIAQHFWIAYWFSNRVISQLFEPILIVENLLEVSSGFPPRKFVAAQWIQCADSGNVAGG